MRKSNRQLVAQKRIAEKRASLAIEELKLKREEERKYALTLEEAQKHERLSELFSDDHPAERIRYALDDDKKIQDVRAEFLAASKTKHEVEQKKVWADGNSVSLTMIAAGLPISVIGIILMGSFQMPGVAVCLSGACMSILSIVSSLFRRRKEKSRLKAADRELDDLSYKLNRMTERIDRVCDEFKIPINDTDRSQKLLPIYQAAQEYESLIQKKRDHELFVRINGSNELKNKIIEDLRLLTGTTITDESAYPGIMEILDRKNEGLLSGPTDPEAEREEESRKVAKKAC